MCPFKNEVLRLALKIIRYTVLAVVLLLAVVLILVQIPSVQTFIGQRALKSFSNKSAGAEITFSSVKIKPFNTLIVKDLAIIDKDPYTVDTTRLDSDRQRIFGDMDYRRVDTLFSAENVTATFTLRGLIGSGVILRSALIRNAQLNLVIEEYGHSINITRMFGIAEKQFRNSEPKDIFLIRKPDIENMHLTVRNYRVLKTHDIDPTGINWNDIDISDLVIHGRNLRLRGKVMSGEADFVSFNEKSGYRLESISGSVKGGGGVTTIENIHLKDSWSDISLPLLQFTYEHPWDFQQFPEKVRITSQLSTTSLSLKSLSYFAPSIPRRDIILNLSGGKVDGPVNALSITSLAFSTPDQLIRGTLTTTLKGLPDTKAMDIDATLKNLHLSSEGAQSLLTMLGTKTDGLEITKYAPGVDFTLNGSLRGGLNNLKFNGYIRSSAGALLADLRVRNLLDKSAAATVGGMVRTTALNLHTIMGSIPVEEVTADAAFDATLGSKKTNAGQKNRPDRTGLYDTNTLQDNAITDSYPEPRGAGIKIDSLKVSGLKFKGYNYTNLFAAGTVAEKRFDGKIVCNDPNLNFLLQGLLTFSRRTNNALYRFYANVGHANLAALNFDKRKRSETDFQISANFTKTGDGVWLGDINLADLNFTDEAGTHRLGNTKIESFSGSGLYQMRLGSSFAEATFSGSAPITRFLKDVGNVTARRELPALFKDPSYEWTGENYTFTFKTFNTTELLSFIVPGVYIAGDTQIDLRLDKNGLLKGKMSSQRLAYKERFIKDVTLSLSNADGTLRGEILGENIDLSPLSIHDNRFSLTAKDNQVELSYSYDNTLSDDSNDSEDKTAKNKTTGDKGEIRLLADMSRSEDNKTVIDVRPQPSAFQLNAKEWTILPSDILLEDKTLTVNNFKIASGDQAISVLGRLSDNFADTLDVTVDRLDLSLADALLGQSAGISGRLSGMARVTSPKDERRLLLNFQCDSASIGGERIGDISLSTKWDETFSKFHILAANSLDGETSFSLYGTYTPSIKQIDMLAKLRKFNLGYASPFLSSVFSEVGGNVSGDLLITGSFDNLSISGRNPVLEDARLRVGYTNVAYTCNGPFHIDDTGVYFDKISLTDDFGNKGRLAGKIGYDHFRDMYLDIDIDLNRLQAINIDERTGGSIYGSLFATGTLGITGGLSAITLAANVSTAGAGELHVPLSSTHNAGLTDLLKFKEPEVEQKVDPYEEYLLRMKEEKTKSNDLNIKLNVDTDPEVEVWVEVDKASGNVLHGTGSGNLEINVRPGANVFNINGDYTLTDGNYHFVALGLAARDFSIDDGSSIRFNGDIMSSTLNIGATYKTKVSLSTLIADTTSTNSRRTVECGIKITDKLSNPRLAFSINIPDLDPTVKAQVESALSTEDKVQKQFLSLLISNSFIPDEQSSIVNNSTLLLSNVSEIMSNQLNTIFQKLNIPLDLGVNYQQNESGNDVFDVAVSTQLFNNRVTVNGNIGNRQYQSSSTGSEVAGDLDIEIKLDRAGSFRLTLFSHSADTYTNYLDDTQRNGIGVTYQQEFDKFGQWVRRVFTSRKKRREQDAENATLQQTEDRVEIKIDAPQ